MKQIQLTILGKSLNSERKRGEWVNVSIRAEVKFKWPDVTNTGSVIIYNYNILSRKHFLDKLLSNIGSSLLWTYEHDGYETIWNGQSVVTNLIRSIHWTMSTLEHNNYNIRLRTDIDRSTVHWPVTCNHLLSGSLALEALLAGVHCKKRYINVWIQDNTIQYNTSPIAVMDFNHIRSDQWQTRLITPRIACCQKTKMICPSIPTNTERLPRSWKVNSFGIHIWTLDQFFSSSSNLI